VTASFFLWLLNKQDVAAAYQFTRVKSERDQLKSICDSNLEKKDGLEIWIGQNKLTAPAELLTEKPCASTGEKQWH
jgi:hypothetical protein